MAKQRDKSKLITGLILLGVGLIIGFDFIVGKIVPLILAVVGFYLIWMYYHKK